jgi:general secretion pathway protein M
VVLALVYALFIGPAMDGRARLRAELPQLRQQAAELQALAREAAALAAQPAIPAPPMTRESIDASLAAHGLKAQSVALTGDYARLDLKGVPFATLADWLDAIRREQRMAVREASITAQPTAGMVDAAITLYQDAKGQR